MELLRRSGVGRVFSRLDDMGWFVCRRCLNVDKEFRARPPSVCSIVAGDRPCIATIYGNRRWLYLNSLRRFEETQRLIVIQDIGPARKEGLTSCLRLPSFVSSSLPRRSTATPCRHLSLLRHSSPHR